MHTLVHFELIADMIKIDMLWLPKMKKLLQEQFGFQQPEIKKLNGYDNANYLIKNKEQRYIFKTYSVDGELADLIIAENEVLLVLQKSQGRNYFPAPIQFQDDSFVKTQELDGAEKTCRMLSFLSGKFFGEVEHSEKLFQSFGNFLAEMDLKLQSITNYTFKARQWEWDIQYLHLNKKYIQDIPKAKDRATVNYFFQQFQENVNPILPELRRQIIHNDANEWNVLTANDKVTGIIDFGDLAYAPLINELAVAITYACYDKEDPLKWAQIILSSYHQILPLERKEVSVLYYLIAARLCISICNSAHSKKENPENEYASSSEQSAWNMLYKWLTINPIEAESCFLSAIDLDKEEPKSIDETTEDRHKFISPILSLSYQKPIVMDRSAFQYMYDVYGHTYLDAYNNIPHVGHSHPKVVEAAQRQMAKLNTNTRYLYKELIEYAEKLLSYFPESLNKVYFVNSGSAASDLAIRLAQAHTGHENLMVMEHGYHGNTQNGIDISDYKFSKKEGQGKKRHIFKAEIPDTYRGEHNNNDGTAGKLYAQAALDQIKSANAQIAAFIAEPIVGCGGQVPLANGYLKEIYPEIRKQGGLCISDEVQTGFGRLGGYFWGYEMQDVVPDMVILGKPMGNGHPIGAVVTTDEVADSFSKGVEFFSSFGGNPVSCAVGLSVLNTIEEEGLQENAQNVGDYYQSLFRELQNQYDCIGDVRGSGLFIGVEIVKDRETKEPDQHLVTLIKNELRNQHILISTDGPSDSVLKTKPPLCFTKENAEKVVGEIERVLKISYI